MLSISGGGEDGAFGAGLLCGMTAAGTRPVYNLVTGVSTGALTAPFAFLGSAYDARVARRLYQHRHIADICRDAASTVSAIFADALTDTTPLFRTISRHVNETMMADIAQAYAAGRLLLIGTTNLDAQVPVIWNIGAIAASGDPRALDLIRRIMLASAAIPGAFPPVMIDVTVDGTELPGDACRRRRLRAGLPLSRAASANARGAARAGHQASHRRDLGDPQRPARSRLGLGAAACLRHQPAAPSPP